MSDHKSALWKLDIPPLPEVGPIWPGELERMSYKGLMLQPETDLEVWCAFEDVWEVSLRRSGDLLMTIRADREQAIAIATKLADGRDWTSVQVREEMDLTSDPLFLGLMAEYPGMVGVPAFEGWDEPEELDDIVPYRNEPDDELPLF